MIPQFEIRSRKLVRSVYPGGRTWTSWPGWAGRNCILLASESIPISHESLAAAQSGFGVCMSYGHGLLTCRAWYVVNV